MRRPRIRSAAVELGLVAVLGCFGPAAAADLYGGGSDLDSELRSLLTSTDAEKRRIGVEQLAGLEPRRAAPHLYARLRDPDASVRARAARALGPGAFYDAAPLLIACLSDADSGVRSACAEALGQFGSLPPDLTARATVTLGRALGDSQYEVRMEALRAIERLFQSRLLGPSEAQLLLGPVLLRAEDEHVGVRRAAVAALGRLGPLSVPAELLRRAVVALLGRLSDSARDVRTEALASLNALGAAEAAPAALRLLQDPAEDVRRQALLYLGRIGYAAAVPLIVELYEGGPETLRRAAAQALGTVARGAGPPAAARALQALLSGLEREEARALSREALLQAGSAAVPALLDRLRQGMASQAEVGAVVDLLRDLGAQGEGKQPLPAALRKQAVEELAAELRRGRLPREQVVDALASQAEPSSARLLVGLLSDPAVAVRRRVIAALRQPGLLDARALDALVATTRDSDHEVSTQATLLLAELPANASQLGRARLLELLRTGDLETRLFAAQALGRSAQRTPPPPFDGSAVSALIGALNSSGEGLAELRVRRAAAAALGQVVTATPDLRGQAVTALLSLLRRGRGAASEAALPDVVAALGSTLRTAHSASWAGAQAEAARRTLLDLAVAGTDSDSSEAALALDALDALGALHDGQAAGRIARLLLHRDPLRRMRAAAALGNLLSSPGGDSGAAALLSALKDDGDLRVVSEAAWALGKLPRGASATGRAAAALHQLLAQREGNAAASYLDPDGAARGVRANALGALARLGQAEAGDAQWLGDTDPGVRANAALLLASLPSRSPGMEARLRDLLVTDEDHRVRENAERALAGPRQASERQNSLTLFQMDHDHKPFAETAYRLTLPDGLVRVGMTDRRGIAREEQLPGGSCEVELLLEPSR